MLDAPLQIPAENAADHAPGPPPGRLSRDPQARLEALTDKQAHYLQDLAIEELLRQKQRIETYQVQARFELAAIYDKTANKPPAKPSAAPPASDTPADKPKVKKKWWRPW